MSARQFGRQRISEAASPGTGGICLWPHLASAVQFGADELAQALGVSQKEVAHRMRALGRTNAYKEVERQQHEDVPIRSRRERGDMRYWMAPWWQNAIRTITSETKQEER